MKGTKPSLPRAIGAILKPLSEVKATSPEWLWPNRIQLGALNVIAGDPGLGKSFLTLDIAARVSTVTPWPDSQEESNPVGNVLILVAEDNLNDAIAPRLKAAGANLEKAVALQAVRLVLGERCFSLERHIKALDSAIADVGDVRAIIIDPIDSYLGNIDGNKNEDVRNVLGPLKELAEQHSIAVIIVKHLNKNVAQGKAIYRVSGSTAFAAFARAVWMTSRDPNDPRRRLLTCVKLNNAEEAKGLAYSIQNGSEGPRIAWALKPVDIRADEALATEQGGGSTPRIESAVEWARAHLSAGPVKSKQLFAEAGTDGIAETTLRRALTKIKAVKQRPRGIKNPEWTWQLAEPKHRSIRSGTTAMRVSPSSNYDQDDKHVSEGRLGRVGQLNHP